MDQRLACGGGEGGVPAGTKLLASMVTLFGAMSLSRPWPPGTAFGLALSGFSFSALRLLLVLLRVPEALIGLLRRLCCCLCWACCAAALEESDSPAVEGGGGVGCVTEGKLSSRQRDSGGDKCTEEVEGGAGRDLPPRFVASAHATTSSSLSSPPFVALVSPPDASPASVIPAAWPAGAVSLV